MELVISIGTNQGYELGVGFGDIETLEDIEASDCSHMEEAFWENYYMFEDDVQKVLSACIVDRGKYSNEKEFENAVFEWMKTHFKKVFAPLTVFYYINDKKAEVSLRFDIEELFWDMISDIATYWYC